MQPTQKAVRLISGLAPYLRMKMDFFNIFKKKIPEPPRDINKETLDKIIESQIDKYGSFPDTSKKLHIELKQLIEKTRNIIQKTKSTLPPDPPKLKELWNNLLGKWISIHRLSGYNDYGYFLGADQYSIYYFNALYGENEMNRRVIFTIRTGEEVYMNCEELPIQGYTTPLMEKFFP